VAGDPGRPGRIAVNLSLRQLKQRNFITRVHDIIRRHGIPPEALEFEITETTLMEDARRTVRILDELHAWAWRSPSTTSAPATPACRRCSSSPSAR
jgi:EAL domain-containing protein (putative c-di-GMP-specific phosphodiesterase class I)